MKNKILNNFALKLLSVVCAIVLWLVVMNISDYAITVEIDDIPVTQLNGDVLEELDKVYDVAKGDTVDIIVKGRRSIVSRLSASDFSAMADLSSMSITNTVQIFVSPKDKTLEDEISITCIDNTMSLNLEEKVTVQFPIKIRTEGSPKEDFAVGETYASPNVVTVEGPKSAVDRITDVAVSVSVHNKSGSFEDMGDIILYDAYGEPVNNDKITVSQDVVNVNVNIYPVKSVEIKVDIKGTPGTGYEVAEVIYQPQSVLVAGLEENLERIDEIEINDISVSGLTENLETTVDLSKYLPDDIFVAQSGAEVVITVSIEKLVEKSLTPQVRDITLDGKLDGYTYAVDFSDDFEIIITGLDHIIETVDIQQLKPRIDCSALPEGTHNNVTITLNDIDGINYEIIGHVTVTVKADE